MNTIIETTTNYEEKVKLIEEINEMIEIEKTTLNNIIESINNVPDNYIIPSKYKKMSIDQLEELFDKTIDVNDKINIYYSMFVKINNIKLEIFS